MNLMTWLALVLNILMLIANIGLTQIIIKIYSEILKIQHIDRLKTDLSGKV